MCLVIAAVVVMVMATEGTRKDRLVSFLTYLSQLLLIHPADLVGSSSSQIKLRCTINTKMTQPQPLLL